MKKTLLSLAVTSVLGLASASASAIGTFHEFTVDESGVPLAESNSFVADKINGGYNEVLTVNGDLTFDTVGYANWGQYFANDGATLVQSQLNSFGAGGYGMYTTFSSSGYLTATGFNGTSGTLYVYIDPDKNTVLSLPGTGSGSISISGDSDDYMIAFATSLIVGDGVVGTPGAFDLWFDDFTLTLAGESYFVAPDPFHLVLETNGDFDAFPSVPGPGDYTNITGDISAVFAIPEPASLALLGLGLIGLGMTRRRKA